MGQPEQDQIDSLVRRFGLEARLHLNPLGSGVADDNRLNLLFNACDVGINTSMGEGWELVSFEHGGAARPKSFPNTAPVPIFGRSSGNIQPVKGTSRNFPYWRWEKFLPQVLLRL